MPKNKKLDIPQEKIASVWPQRSHPCIRTPAAMPVSALQRVCQRPLILHSWLAFVSPPQGSTFPSRACSRKPAAARFATSLRLQT